MAAVIVSTTIASVTELAGKVKAPEIFKLVPVALVKTRLANVPTAVKLGKEVVAEVSK